MEQFKSDEESQRFLGDATVMRLFAGAKRLSDVRADDYDAIFYVGGYGSSFSSLRHTHQV